MWSGMHGTVGGELAVEVQEPALRAGPGGEGDDEEGGEAGVHGIIKV